MIGVGDWYLYMLVIAGLTIVGAMLSFSNNKTEKRRGISMLTFSIVFAILMWFGKDYMVDHQGWQDSLDARAERIAYNNAKEEFIKVEQAEPYEGPTCQTLREFSKMNGLTNILPSRCQGVN